jgi:hypothetical protein
LITFFIFDTFFIAIISLSDSIALVGGIRNTKLLLRELNKAYLGFSCNTNGAAIATGNSIMIA